MVQSGVFVDDDFCRDYAVTLPFTLNLTQSQDMVTGTFLLGQIPFVQTTASVLLNGELVLASKNATGGEASIDAVWTINSARPHQLTGTVRHSWLAKDNGGAATVTGMIESAGHQTLADLSVGRLLVSLDDFRRRRQRSDVTSDRRSADADGLKVHGPNRIRVGISVADRSLIGDGSMVPFLR